MSTELTQERRNYQDYSIDRKAEVLALLEANNNNLTRTAQETGITHSTIQYWRSNKDHLDEIRIQKQTDLALQCENDANYYFLLARNKAEEAPFNHLVTAGATLTDKMLVLRNQPTSIVQTQHSESLTLVLQQVLSEITEDNDHNP